MRKLATIRKIIKIEPIENADYIELATVDGWRVIVKKGEFSVDDLAVYFEIDSFLPIKPEFEFLRKNSYKKMVDGSEGFRLKTIRMKGVLSQGLLLKPSDLGIDNNLDIGTDVSELLGVVKYDPPIPTQLSGVAKGNFPYFIPKTDEERIQNLRYDDLLMYKYYVTEKLDGSSVTIFYNNDKFGVCSRNLELTENETNSFWRAARKLNIESKLKNLGRNIALQGELVGYSVQNNPYKMNDINVYFFNAFDIDLQKYLTVEDFKVLLMTLDVNSVPVISECYDLPDNRMDLIKYADGLSILNNDCIREGFVFKTNDRDISFKVISNQYLMKQKD